jgi:NAD(P)H-dependent flavin oxidoreductase YrpB (nitropropane dioxygenase family)
MKCVDDFRLRLGNKEYVPIMVGGMGVDISTSELALEAARLGGGSSRRGGNAPASQHGDTVASAFRRKEA